MARADARGDVTVPPGLVPQGTTELGIDIIKVDRIRAALDRFGPRFSRRVLTEAEQRYVRDRPETMAGRWAAKEAVLKALGTGWRRGISWRDVEIRNERSGSPTVALRGGARDYMEQQKISQVLVSISHCRTHATAYAIAVSEPKSKGA